MTYLTKQEVIFKVAIKNVGLRTYLLTYNITSIALKSSGARAQKRNKTKSLIIFKSRGHAGVIISLRGRRLFKVEKQF